MIRRRRQKLYSKYLQRYIKLMDALKDCDEEEYDDLCDKLDAVWKILPPVELLIMKYQGLA